MFRECFGTIVGSLFLQAGNVIMLRGDMDVRKWLNNVDGGPCEWQLQV